MLIPTDVDVDLKNAYIISLTLNSAAILVFVIGMVFIITTNVSRKIKLVQLIITFLGVLYSLLNILTLLTRIVFKSRTPIGFESFVYFVFYLFECGFLYIRLSTGSKTLGKNLLIQNVLVFICLTLGFGASLIPEKGFQLAFLIIVFTLNFCSVFVDVPTAFKLKREFLASQTHVGWRTSFGFEIVLSAFALTCAVMAGIVATQTARDKVEMTTITFFATFYIFYRSFYYFCYLTSYAANQKPTQDGETHDTFSEIKRVN